MSLTIHCEYPGCERRDPIETVVNLGRGNLQVILPERWAREVAPDGQRRLELCPEHATVKRADR